MGGMSLVDRVRPVTSRTSARTAFTIVVIVAASTAFALAGGYLLVTDEADAYRTAGLSHDLAHGLALAGQLAVLLTVTAAAVMIAREPYRASTPAAGAPIAVAALVLLTPPLLAGRAWWQITAHVMLAPFICLYEAFLVLFWAMGVWAALNRSALRDL